jgi:hypothetical protein
MQGVVRAPRAVTKHTKPKRIPRDKGEKEDKGEKKDKWEIGVQWKIMNP